MAKDHPSSSELERGAIQYRSGGMMRCCIQHLQDADLTDKILTACVYCGDVLRRNPDGVWVWGGGGG